ncbi:MAG: GIY-YIG nuclease family protein [Gammaproteobacteria bacterium]|nr:GIY-YIG nuclease family protein [Gemmatimonadota bacterium]MYH49587.1 GIY-YIG nuclease family protein [Gammaproteobacteria bacterium]MYI58160.1 GIY-YIG nuclease family protein [Acidimicrobiaceae bacterium]MYL06313.1 GIY-YIG nuclease family protein [Gemmatimonadales bacterium]MCY3676933.1 GIY-YIG nuclease family protein [Gemmatimonadota bacterium]
MKETPEVVALYSGIAQVLNTKCSNGKRVGDCKHGVYLFYDYDHEPIYVGQTREKLRTRIRRHLTNQRTDAVAMSVLDPFEVADIELWPFWDMPTERHEVDDILRRAEYTVYQRALERSSFKVILNEAEIPAADLIPLPPSIKASILGAEDRRYREHPDVRLARRARTIANLARVISERRVKVGIRRTLWAQARRLEMLAQKRLEDFNGG